MTDEKQEQEVPAVPNLVELLKGFENAPSTSQVEEWKRQFGEVFVSGFSETEIYVWHPLSRATYVELKKVLSQPKPGATEPPNELDFEEAVVEKCIVWTSDSGSFKTKGGTVSTLSEQIMTSSNFLNPGVASMFVMKL